MTTRPLADILNGACADPKLIVGGDPDDMKMKRYLAASLRAKLRGARRFYVDEDITRAATRLGVQHPNVLLEMLHRARPPFETVWLEWPIQAQIEEAQVDYADDSPERTGCFVEQVDAEQPLFQITMLSSSPRNRPHDNSIILSQLAILYHLRSPIALGSSITSLEEGLALLAKTPYAYAKQALVGAAYMQHTDDDADEEERQQRQKYCDALATYASWIPNPLLAQFHRDIMSGRSDHKQYSIRPPGEDRQILSAPEALRRSISVAITEHAGEWRFVISLLALLNAQNFVQHEHFRAGKSRLVHGHVVPYLEHLLVKLKLPRRIVEERMLRNLTTSMGRRRHDVTGSFRESRKRGDPNCDHAWVQVTSTKDRCALCGRAYWWVDGYERGNAALGYVIKDRLVTRD